jgi:hypothetical protein
MYWTLPVAETPKVIEPMNVTFYYKLEEQGTRLWHSTEHTDQYYRKWFLKLASQAFPNARAKTKVEVYDHEGKLLGTTFTPNKNIDGPP